jgi:hypothetical protein
MSAQTIITRDSDPAGLLARLTMPPAFFKRVNETRFRQEWKLTPLQYLALKLGWDGHGSPKYQRGMLSGMGVKRAITAGAPAGSVLLNPHTLLDQRFNAGTCDARIQFQNDGQLFAFRQVGSDFEYNGEWWTNEEEASIGDGYECRHISAGKTGFYDVQAAVADTWITITTGREWGVTQSTTGSQSTTATFECGLDAVESALDSAIFTVTATVDDA